MKKHLLLIFMLIVAAIGTATAQTATITGKVTAVDDGLPLPGVSVKIKGSTIGTQTDKTGQYALKVPQNAILVFSYLGFTSTERPVPASGVLNVTLSNEIKGLSEVVVTSQGIRREKRTLGYSAPTVSNNELTQGENPSVLTSLTGRVAGVNITSASNTPGSSTRIVLRGGSSITGNNQALLVVDGVPIDNSSIISGGSSLSAVDFGNRGNDIDPNDIESVTVLKGPAAAALYGSRASNGALMITTKSGANRAKKTEITFNSTGTFSSVLKLPTFQNEYGQGFMSGSATSADYVTGIDDASDNFSWGGPFTGKVEPWGQQIDGINQMKPYSALPNNIKDFFTTGFALDNNVGIASGDDKSSFFLSLNSLNSNSIYPGNSDTYNKYGVRFNGKTKLTNNFTAGINFNYNKIQANTPSNGQNANGIWNSLMQTPRDLPIDKMGDLNNKYNGYNPVTNTYGFYGAFVLNPYWVLKNFSNLDDVNRVTGDVNLSYKAADWLNITERVGIDSYSDRRKLISPKYFFNPADESGAGLWGPPNQ